MHIKVTPTNTTFSVDVVDDDENYIDGYEGVEADDVDGTIETLKNEHYDVKSFLEEILQGIETDQKYLRTDEEVHEGGAVEQGVQQDGPDEALGAIGEIAQAQGPRKERHRRRPDPVVHHRE